jgi:hypothetical protein
VFGTAVHLYFALLYSVVVFGTAVHLYFALTYLVGVGREQGPDRRERIITDRTALSD